MAVEIEKRTVADRTVLVNLYKNPESWLDFFDESERGQREFIATVKIEKTPQRTILFVQAPSRIVVRHEVLKGST